MFGVKDAVEVVERQSGVGGRRGIPRWLLAALAVLVVVGAFFAIRQLTAAEPASAPQTVAARRGAIASTVSATGSVVSQSSARLSFKTSGRVAEVRVRPGDAVQAGQTLARLESNELALQVAQQRAALASAQAKLETVKAGPRPEDVAAAEASVANAQANLDSVKAGALPAELSAAEQGVQSALSQVQTTRANLTKLRGGASSQDLNNAQQAVNQARNNLSSAVIDRDTICDRSSTSDACQQARYRVSNASSAVTTAQNNLAKLRTPASAAEIAAATASVSAAENSYNSAVSKLNDLKSGPKAAQFAAAEAQLATAQANLAKAQRPYTDTDLLSAQAAVDQAQAQLDLADLNLKNATLTAPIAGVVSTVGISLGELAGATATATNPAVVLVNPTDVRLDVNVDETDVAKVALSQKVQVTFDALPSGEFAGTVAAIAPSATITSGVSTYVVTVALDSAEQVRPGMTGSASIVYAEKADALLVPNRTIRRDGSGRSVEVFVGDKTEARTVQVGMSNDDESEILEGVAEGDLVVIPTTTSFQFNMSNRTGGAAPARAGQ